MFSLSRFLVLIVALLCGAWQSVLYAIPLEKLPNASVPSSSFLLVASSQMRDPRFRESVLLVTRHGLSGRMGIIVNRPQDVSLDKLFPDFPEAKEMKLFTGGPVYPEQISYLVRDGEVFAGALVVAANLYIAYDQAILGELLSGKRGNSGFRVVHGLAAWAPGQLENEIGRGGWFVMPLDDAVIFDIPPQEMWAEMNRRARSVKK